MARSTSVEHRTIERFRPRYDRPGSKAERAVERAGIGAVVGCNGYTTIMQATDLARRLRLRPGMRVLDIGCGRGFPGLHVARLTGCDVVGSDLPVTSLRSAGQRAVRERLGRRASFVAASALQLPFRGESFDAVVHTDVLCWLRAKLSVLRACQRLLKPGGRIAFTTIYIAAGVSASEYRRASRARGPGAAEKRAITELLEAAGFVSIRERDETRAFSKTTSAFVETSDLNSNQLRAEWGAATFDERQRDRRRTLALVEEGILRRGLFTARRPMR